MGLYVCGTPGPAGCRMRGSRSPSRRIEALVRGSDDRFRSEAELLEQDTRSRAGSVVVDADDSPSVTDEVTPTDADSGFDRDARLDLGRDDRILVALVLLVEPLPTRQRHHSRLDALLGEQPLRCDNVLHLRAGPHQDHIRGPVAVFEDVAAFCYLRSIGEAVFAPREDWHSLPGQGQPGWPVVVPQDRRPGGGGLIGVGRTDHIESRDGPQCGEVFDRLMSRAIFAQTD